MDSDYSTSIEGTGIYQSGNYSGYPAGAHGDDGAGLNTGVQPATYVNPPDYGSYPFPAEFPRTSSAHDFGAGGGSAPDVQTDEGDQMSAYQSGVTDIFGQHRPPVPMAEWAELPGQSPNLSY